MHLSLKGHFALRGLRVHRDAGRRAALKTGRKYGAPLYRDSRFISIVSIGADYPRLALAEPNSVPQRGTGSLLQTRHKYISDTDIRRSAGEREISSFECAVCGKTIENWNSAWVPRYRFIACYGIRMTATPNAPGDSNQLAKSIY
jgi:hypothetical protein